MQPGPGRETLRNLKACLCGEVGSVSLRLICYLSSGKFRSLEAISADRFADGRLSDHGQWDQSTPVRVTHLGKTD